jgi:hypothetical protein
MPRSGQWQARAVLLGDQRDVLWSSAASFHKRPDTVGQPDQGEDVASVLVGSSIGRSPLGLSLRAVSEDTHHFLSENIALRRV